MAFLDYLHTAASHSHLTEEQAEQAMQLILDGEATPAQIAGFLVALRMKGETAGEVTGFARAMRSRCHRVDAGPGDSPLLDTCGTGGDGLQTFNVSTAAAFVAAGAGARVAKHGNRSISSQCGSADVLEGLGIRIALTPVQMGQCIREAGIGFLFAPALHPAMKHAQPARLELRMRTVFNLLGPLANPAGASFQLVGAYSREAAERMAEALSRLGTRGALVVHGADGLDEITTSGPTLVFEVSPGRVVRREVTPEDFGLTAAPLESLVARTREESVAVVSRVLAGERGPARDIVLMNSAAGLVAAGIARDFRHGVELAGHSIDSGLAAGKLDHLARLTRSFPPGP